MKQFNIIIDVLGGWSVDVEETMKDLVGQRSRSVLRPADAESDPVT